MIGGSDGKQYESDLDFIMGKAAEFNEKNKAKPAKPNTENEIYFGDQNPAEEEAPAVGLITAPLKSMADLGYRIKDIFDGRIKPGTEEYGRTIAEIGINMIGLPAPVASKMVDGTLGSFMGVKSKTLDKAKLYEAQNMKADGFTRDEIWSKTGTYQGPDGRWRQEIPDVASKILDGKLDIKPSVEHPNGDFTRGQISLKGESKLPEILDHPELYKAYPQLKDINIAYLDPKWEGKAGALWDAQTNTIQINKEIPNTTMLRTLLLHEIKHAVQDIEGFAKGGNPGMFKPKELPYLEDTFKKGKVDYERQITESMGVLPTDIVHFKNAVRTELTDPKSKYVLDEWRKRNPEAVSKIELLVKTEEALKKNEAANVEKYMRLMGEVEARNVERRQFYDKFDRELTPPWRSQDRPDNVQIPFNGIDIPE